MTKQPIYSGYYEKTVLSFYQESSLLVKNLVRKKIKKVNPTGEKKIQNYRTKIFLLTFN